MGNDASINCPVQNPRCLITIERKTGSSTDAVLKQLGESDRFYLVFHGGSGSRPDEIRDAVDYGMVKMNVDADMHKCLHLVPMTSALGNSSRALQGWGR